jgi:hypothetical protein
MTARVTGAIQFPCVATAVLTPANAGTSGTGIKLLTIPEDAMLLYCYLHVITAFDDGTSLTVDIGENIDADQFTTAPIDLQTAAVTALTDAVGVQFGVTGEVTMDIVAGAGDAEVGKAVVYIGYLRPDAAHGVG